MKSVTLVLPSWMRPTATAAAHRYVLPVPTDLRRGLALGWLVLGVAALIGSGIFSVLLVLARTPQLQGLFPVADFFHVALVVHVDLSVLVWFVAFAGVLWTLDSRPRRYGLAVTAFVFALTGTIIMAAAPFVGRGRPIMSNYVPVLDDSVFLAGLAVFGVGFALLCIRSLWTPAHVEHRLSGTDALRFGLNTAAVSGAVTMIALAWSWMTLPSGLEGKPYYEMLFWGGGHAVQFTWTLLMLVAWLWLATLSGARLPLTPRMAVLMFGVGLAAIFTVPVIYLAWDVASIEHQKMHTWLMRFGGGLAILPLGLAVLIGLLRGEPCDDDARPLRAALVTSMFLFAAGGVIGFLIRGADVRVPAHYHGAIVGVTLALMGLAYALLPEFGFERPHRRWAAVQPWVYGIGQLLHIIGLVWSGGYGVQRKVAGASQVLRTPQEIAGMGLMGLGGLIAIVGGVMFIVIVLRALSRGRR